MKRVLLLVIMFLVITLLNSNIIITKAGAESNTIKYSYTEGFVEKQLTTNLQDYQESLRSSNQYNNIEIAKQIRLEIGDDSELINNMSNELLLESLGYLEVITETIYVKQDQYQNQVTMSKWDIYEDIESIKQKQINYMVNSSDYSPIPEDENYSRDNYLKITSRAIRVIGPPDNFDYYIISGEIEWLMEPFWKFTDSLVIASTAITDDSYNFYGYMYRKYTYFDSGNQSTSEYIDECFKSDNSYQNIYVSNRCGSGLVVDANIGALWTFSFDASHTIDLSELIIYGQYRVISENNIEEFQIAYAHKILMFGDISVSVNFPLSVSFSLSFSIGVNEYKSYIMNIRKNENYIDLHHDNSYCTTHIYQEYNSNYHITTCHKFDDTFYQFHRFGYFEISSLFHQIKCLDCEYIGKEYHRFVNWKLGLRCRNCGYYTIGPVVVNSKILLGRKI